MARRAAWRARKDDPRTILGWAFQDDGSRWVPVPVAFVLMVVAGALAVGWSVWALLLVPTVALHVRRSSRVPAGLDALETVPPPGPAFRVRLEVYEGGLTLTSGLLLGTDEGIATFVDGWFFFAGLRTDFAIRDEDVVGAAKEARGERLTLREAGALRLVVTDLEERTLLRASVDEWLRDSREGESILPPRSMHSSGLVRAWCDALSSALGTVLGTLVFTHWIGSGAVLFFAPVSFEVYRRLGRARRMASESRRSLANEKRPLFGP